MRPPALTGNSQNEPLTIGVAINADVPAISTEPGGGWILLAPYGETAYTEKENGAWQTYTQIFQRVQAQSMVSAFNAAHMKRGTHYRGLPIYVGHPDADLAEDF